MTVIRSRAPLPERALRTEPGPRPSAVLVLAQQLAEARIVADRVEVAVLAHVAEVAVAQLDGRRSVLRAWSGRFEQGVAAGEVVVGQRVVGPQLHQPLVDLQPLGVAALERQVVAHDAQHVDVVGLALEDAAEEVELEIELALVGQAQPAALPVEVGSDPSLECFP